MKNCLKQHMKILKKSNGKYVLVEGIFNSKKKGHFDRYSGTIDNITRYELWK